MPAASLATRLAPHRPLLTAISKTRHRRHHLTASTTHPPIPTHPSGPAMTSAASEPRKFRILCLHGYTQSGPLFRSKTRALEKNLQKHLVGAPNGTKANSSTSGSSGTSTSGSPLPDYPGGVEFVYPTAPIRLRAADIPTFDSNVTSTSSSLGDDNHDSTTQGDGKAGAVRAMGGDEQGEAYGWWTKRDDSEGGTTVVVYDGLEESVALWARAVREEGPFDGVLGFSQGGAAAVMFASLLEEGRGDVFRRSARGRDQSPLAFSNAFVDAEAGKPLQGPLKAVVVYSGFRAPGEYDAFYEGGLSTPSLHFIGSVDTVVEEHRCVALLEACRYGNEGAAKANGAKTARKKEVEDRHRLVYHPGGHFVPSSQKPSVNAVVQFIRDVAGKTPGTTKEPEQRVEDMDLPF